MKQHCPRCGHELTSVSALTHGCYPCQRLFLMSHGRLEDRGPWNVASKFEYRKLVRQVGIGLVILITVYLALLGGVIR